MCVFKCTRTLRTFKEPYKLTATMAYLIKYCDIWHDQTDFDDDDDNDETD